MNSTLLVYVIVSSLVDIRTIAVATLMAILPKTERDEWFDSVMCQGRMSDPKYSPGPDLCHWLLWKIGCRDSKILCRDVPDCDIVYNGNAIKQIVSGSQRMIAWKSFVLENSPEPGDILHLGSIAHGEPEHICVFLQSNGKFWTTADVIISYKTGLWTAQEVVRKLNGSRLVDEAGVTKRLNGWVNIRSLTYDAS